VLIGNGVVLSPSALMAEIRELEAAGVELRSRLSISPACPLVLPCHVALDQAREAAASGTSGGKIGTTGRGIGPAYETRSRVERCGCRTSSTRSLRRQAEGAARVPQFRAHAVLQGGARAVREDPRRHARARAGDRAMVADVSARIHEMRARGESLVFEGAQGALLDIDTAPIPSSPAPTASPARPRPAAASARSSSTTCSASSRRTRRASAAAVSHRAH